MTARLRSVVPHGLALARSRNVIGARSHHDFATRRFERRPARVWRILARIRQVHGRGAMKRSELSDLAAFVAVADELSFRAGAARLGITRSALSHAMQQL